MRITVARWPCQGYGWFPHKNGKGKKAFSNLTGARFGGGWKWKLGIAIGGNTIIIDLLFGNIRIDWGSE